MDTSLAETSPLQYRRMNIAPSLGVHPAVQIFKSATNLRLLVLTAALAGCSQTTPNPNLPKGAAAYATIPVTKVMPSEYIVRPLDVLSVRVFNEPELTMNDLSVSETGTIEMPLVGSLKAAGTSLPDLRAQITKRLAAKYLVDPQVAVSVKTLAPRYVSVEGQVNKPGIYEIGNGTTLLSAIARAESPTRTAKLNEVVVFRTVDNQRLVARFNLKDIRTGIAPDPAIIDGDVVMIGFSATRGAMEDVLRAAPLVNAWSRF